MFLTILSNLFVAVIVILLFFYLFIYSRIIIHKKSKTSFNPFVSVIICAKNEANNLKNNIPFILNQKYNNFELILVNDHSTDNSLQQMQDFKNKATIPIKIIDIQNQKSKGNKKNALTKGINNASGAYLLLTDADCIPNSSFWIQEMVDSFNNKEIVLGYGAYKKIKNSFLNKLIRFETLLTAIQYFSYAKLGIPYMGVGRNLAYKKELFTKTEGFKNHQHIKSGDDDLFINESSNKNNVAINLNQNSFTISDVHKSFNKWYKQKRRHITTANHYKLIKKFLLGLFYFVNFLFWLLFIMLIVLNGFTTFLFISMLIKFLIQYLIFGLSAKKLNEKDLILFIPFLELFLIVIQMCLFLHNKIKKPTHW